MNLQKLPVANEQFNILIEENGRKIEEKTVKSDENGFVTLTLYPTWPENDEEAKSKRNLIFLRVN